MSLPHHESIAIWNVNMGLPDAIVDAGAKGGVLLTPHPVPPPVPVPGNLLIPSIHPGEDEIKIEIKTGSELKTCVHLNPEAKHHRRPIRCS